jgi:hypothetical protein
LALRIVKRKNDSESQRRGHNPAAGRSLAVNPDLDLVHQLRVRLRVLGIARNLLCSSRAGVHCSACCPVFFRLVLGSGLGSMYVAASSRPMSGSMVRDAVRRMAALCQGNPLRRAICGPSQPSPSC